MFNLKRLWKYLNTPVSEFFPCLSRMNPDVANASLRHSLFFLSRWSNGSSYDVVFSQPDLENRSWWDEENDLRPLIDINPSSGTPMFMDSGFDQSGNIFGSNGDN